MCRIALVVGLAARIKSTSSVGGGPRSACSSTIHGFAHGRKAGGRRRCGISGSLCGCSNGGNLTSLTSRWNVVWVKHRRTGRTSEVAINLANVTKVCPMTVWHLATFHEWSIAWLAKDIADWVGGIAEHVLHVLLQSAPLFVRGCTII